jgi:hypothetical protein
MEQGVGLNPALLPSATQNLATSNGEDLLTESSLNIILEEEARQFFEDSNPRIMLQISRDGGYTYGTELWIKMGAIGQYRRRAEWRRLGVSRSFVFKFRITDPVKVVIISATAMLTQAAK